MADAPKLPTAPAVNPLLAKATIHLATLEEEARKLVGKPGLNPFLFIGQEINPLREAVKGGDVAAAEKALALSLPKSTNVPVAEKK